MQIGRNLAASDHNEIRFEITWEVSCSPNEILVPDFRKADYKGLRKYLGKVGNIQLSERGDVVRERGETSPINGQIIWAVQGQWKGIIMN